MGQLFDWADCVRGSLGSLLLEKQEEQVEEEVVVGLAQCISSAFYANTGGTGRQGLWLVASLPG